MRNSYPYETDLTFTVSAARTAEEYSLAVKIMYRFEEGEFYVDDVHVIEPRGGIYSPTVHEAPAWLWRIIESDEQLRAECFADDFARYEAEIDDHADMLRRERQLERGQ